MSTHPDELDSGFIRTPPEEPDLPTVSAIKTKKMNISKLKKYLRQLIGPTVRIQHLSPNGESLAGLSVFVRHDGREIQVCEVRATEPVGIESLPWAAFVGGCRAINLEPVQHEHGFSLRPFKQPEVATVEGSATGTVEPPKEEP